MTRANNIYSFCIYRSSLHSTFDIIKSKILEHNI